MPISSQESSSHFGGRSNHGGATSPMTTSPAMRSSGIQEEGVPERDGDTHGHVEAAVEHCQRAGATAHGSLWGQTRP
jgi:hypothetical protein